MDGGGGFGAGGYAELARMLDTWTLAVLGEMDGSLDHAVHIVESCRLRRSCRRLSRCSCARQVALVTTGRSCALTSDQPQSLSVTETLVRRIPYRRFSAVRDRT